MSLNDTPTDGGGTETDPLGDPDALAEAIDEASGEPAPSAGAGGGGGALSRLGPLSNTEPNPDISDVDAPELNRAYSRKFAWRALLKVQNSDDPMAIFDFMMAGAAWATSAMLAESGDGERELQSDDLDLDDGMAADQLDR